MIAEIPLREVIKHYVSERYGGCTLVSRAFCLTEKADRQAFLERLEQDFLDIVRTREQMSAPGGDDA